MTPFESAVRGIVLRMRTESTITGKVMSIDGNMCMIDDEGIERPARLVAVETEAQDVSVVIPKVGSMVTCSVLHHDETQLQVIGYTQVEQTRFNDGKNGGLIIHHRLKEEYDKTKALLDAILEITNGSAIPEAGAGAPSAFQAALKVVLAGKSTGDLSDIINNKVTH